MQFSRFVLVTLAIGTAIVGIEKTSFAQDPKSAPNHVHYKEPAQQTVSPTGAIAPRLQKPVGHEQMAWRVYMRNTPNRVGSIGALRLTKKASVSARRVSEGAMTPSSHSRAVA